MRPIPMEQYLRRFALVVASAAVLACGTSIRHSKSPVEEALAGPIHVYVWRETPEGHEPIPGARVFVLTTEGRETASVLTDLFGEAKFPNSLDRPDAKYLFAEVEGFYLCGLPWRSGSREYDLPLHVQMLINRITVPAPRP